MDNEVKIQFKNSVTGEKKLEKYKETLTQINSVLNGINKNKGTTKDLEDSAKSTKDMSNNINDMKKKTDIAFNYTTVRAFTRGIQNAAKAMGSYIQKSSTYLENMNLLDVAFNNNTTEAQKFVNKLSEMYGLDESWGYRTVGIFKQLANAMGLADKIGTKLSTTMTQFAIDVSSLYNFDTDDSVSILTSALAGQTKPARRLGADITQGTLQQTLDKAGIEKSIADLSYAEKRLVIVASLLTQVSEATNDWGRTIESPANQTRILSEQWERLTRAFGNVMLPIVKKILPYVNGILMALTEIFNIIASLLGYNEEDFNFFGAADTSAIDLGDDIATAADNTKKLKKELSGLRSFDKLINITTPKNTGAGSGGVSTGVSADIANLANKAMDDYNSKLKDVEMKATKIRDSIMQWLGFTKEVDEKTGKVSWKFDHITGGTVLGALVVGGAIFKGIKAILGMFSVLTGGKLGKMTKSTMAWYAAILSVIAGYTLLKKGMDNISKGSGKTFFKMNIEGLKEMMLGISGLMTGFALLGNKITALGKYGGPIGMLTGAVVGMVMAIKDGLEQIERAHKSTSEAGKKYRDELKKMNDDIIESTDKQVEKLEVGKKYIELLNEITDKNGKVKKSYESRANSLLTLINETYGTEYKLVGRQITINGKEATSIDNITKSVDEMIDAKKREYALEALKDGYIEKLKQRKKAQDELNGRQETYNTMLEEFEENMIGAARKYHITINEYKKSLKRQKSGLEDLQNTIDGYDKDIKNYDDLIRAHVEGNTKKVDDQLAKFGIKTSEYTTRQAEESEKKWNETLANIKQKFKNPFKTSAEIKVTANTSSAENSLLNFATKLKNFNINDFIKKADGGVFSGGKWNPIQRYDTGGTPNTGQLFWARENGLPELVGTMGGHTAVMNNDQIVGSVSDGVYRATLAANSRTKNNNSGTQQINIYLDKSHKLASYTLGELQSMAKSNGKAIEIR